MILYYFVEFAGSFANIALLLLFIGRLFPKKEPVSKWFYVYVVLMIAGQCALSLFPDWVTQRTIYLLVGGFFLALLFYEVRPWQAVFASGAFFTLIALVEVLAMLLIGLRIPDTDILMQAGAARLVYVVFSNLIQVPLVVLISHFFSRKGNLTYILCPELKAARTVLLHLPISMLRLKNCRRTRRSFQDCRPDRRAENRYKVPA